MWRDYWWPSQRACPRMCFFQESFQRSGRCHCPARLQQWCLQEGEGLANSKGETKGKSIRFPYFQEHLIFDAFFVYSLMSPQKLMETSGYPKGQHPGRLGRKTGRRWMPPLRRPRKPWRRPVRKLIRLMSWRKKRMRSGVYPKKMHVDRNDSMCIYPKKWTTGWKAQGFRNLRPWWQLLVFFLQLLHTFARVSRWNWRCCDEGLWGGKPQILKILVSKDISR